MRNIIILCLAFVYYFNNQNKDKALGKIVFSFEHMRDTSMPNRLYNEEMVLFFNNSSALYQSNAAIEQDSLIQTKTLEGQTTDGGVINLGVYHYTTPEMIFTDKNAKGVFSIMPFQNNTFIIKQSFENISWQIDTAMRNIKGYLCQKATGKYKGRIYTAWFTTDIPASFGPWKLHGLPGLILEAYDAKKQVLFLCKNIETGGQYPPLSLPEYGVKTNKQDFDKMVNAFKNNPFPSNGDGIEITDVKLTSSSVYKNAKTFNNNPIELDEK